jgi:hypothetical protein
MIRPSHRRVPGTGSECNVFCPPITIKEEFIIEEIRGRLGDPISGDDAAAIRKKALLQAFRQVDNSGKRKVGQACLP